MAETWLRNAIVSNSPCGVESFFNLAFFLFLFQFLIHRVELKDAVKPVLTVVLSGF